MSGKYTSSLQVCLLLDEQLVQSPAQVLSRFVEALGGAGIPLNLVQNTPQFAYYAGPSDLYISVEFLDGPADSAVFAGALGSNFVVMMAPDARERVARHRSHVLIEVQHGVMGGVVDNPEIASFFDTIDMPVPGRSLPQFNSRVLLLSRFCEVFIAQNHVSLVHWTQSNMLIPPEKLSEMASHELPSMLTVHPIIYGDGTAGANGINSVGIKTLGAADFLGREINVKPAPVPWADQLQMAFAFIKIAIQENGYVIPDDETFGPEHLPVRYLVRHREADTPGCAFSEAHYELNVQYDRRHDYRAPDYVPPAPLPGGVVAAEDLLNPYDPDELKQLDKWEQDQERSHAAGVELKMNIRGAPSPMEPDDDEPPSIVERAKAFEAERGHEDEEPDPNDPMEIAIRQRVEELKVMGQLGPTESSDDAPDEGRPQGGAGFGNRKGSFGRRKSG